VAFLCVLNRCIAQRGSAYNADTHGLKACTPFATSIKLHAWRRDKNIMAQTVDFCTVCAL